VINKGPGSGKKASRVASWDKETAEDPRLRRKKAEKSAHREEERG